MPTVPTGVVATTIVTLFPTQCVAPVEEAVQKSLKHVMDQIEGISKDVAKIMGHVWKVKVTVTKTVNAMVALSVDVIIASVTSLQQYRNGGGNMIVAMTLILQKTRIHRFFLRQLAELNLHVS